MKKKKIAVITSRVHFFREFQFENSDSKFEFIHVNRMDMLRGHEINGFIKIHEWRSIPSVYELIDLVTEQTI